MINSICNNVDRILDAEACCKDGVYYLGRLPSCLPALFTVRFTVPKDFAAGDTIVVKEVEMPVMTSQMEPASADIFKAGAVIVCEIDMDRKLAFVRTGSGACACEDVKFQTSDLVYYIDPNGDDSPNNPGGKDSPFRTLAGAGRAAWENIVMNPLGRLIFSFNPGRTTWMQRIVYLWWNRRTRGKFFLEGLMRIINRSCGLPISVPK